MAVRAVAVLLAILLCTGGASAYSVLTHEEIVDLVWTDDLRPLLLKRFSGLTADQLTEAHAYAYGGAVIQDLGYYPFGSVEFSDLLHYVRSGDFVQELLLQSQDANEYAFALGALAHYASDIAGHPAVNASVSIRYPKLRAKFGKSVRHAQEHTAHFKEGSALRPDDDANEQIYDHTIKAKQIVRGEHIVVPLAGRHLVNVLEKSAPQNESEHAASNQ